MTTMTTSRSLQEQRAFIQKIWRHLQQTIAMYTEEQSRLEACQRRGRAISKFEPQELHFGGDVNAVHKLFLELADESVRTLSIENIQTLSFTMASYLDVEMDQPRRRADKVSRTFRQSKMGIAE
jgi:glucosamine 6-phosphate synthetase-like amidotransferase/phosphosugar isomerase protein